MREKLISINGLSYRYDTKEKDMALKNIHLNVYRGEWLSIVGHNGSGKSTLAKFLNGLLSPEEYEKVIVDQIDTADLLNIWEVRKKVGMVFQNPDNQIVATTVRDDIAFGLENIGIERSEMEERINYAVSKVKMEDYIDNEPHRLSGGQKQRVAIAGVLAMKPTVMIFDESTSMLDPMGRKEVLQTLVKLNKEDGITIICITHDLEETLLSDRIVVMKEGEIILEGQPKDVYSNQQKIVSAGLEQPFVIELQNDIVNYGYQLPNLSLTEEDLVNELWKLALKT